MSDLSLLIGALQDKFITKPEVCDIIGEFSKRLAKEEQLRHDLPVSAPSLWIHLANNWKHLEDSSIDLTSYSSSILSLARFTRNLVAGVSINQQKAFQFEPEIRSVIFRLTAFTEINKEESYPITRMIVQTLSNIITGNTDLSSMLWKTYIAIPEEQEIIARLLASPDVKTISATLVMILNSINSIPELTARNVLRLLIKILDRTEVIASNEEESLLEDEAFIFSYRIFENLFQRGFARVLFKALSIEDEPITPHQTAFLKLLDSYLNSIKEEPSNCDYTFLTDNLLRLSTYTQTAIKQSLRIVELKSSDEENEPVLQDLDTRLPNVASALILLAQCTNTICLYSQDRPDAALGKLGYQSVVGAGRSPGFIESLIETLKQLDRFLPRIVFGKAVLSPNTSTAAETNDTKGFTYVKRDLVRLVGTLCYNCKDMQDRVRDCEGIPVIMSLCVIDERNPYLQEHALFALRNILHKNIENQAVVDALKLIEEKGNPRS